MPLVHLFHIFFDFHDVVFGKLNRQQMRAPFVTIAPVTYLDTIPTKTLATDARYRSAESVEPIVLEAFLLVCLILIVDVMEIQVTLAILIWVRWCFVIGSRRCVAIIVRVHISAVPRSHMVVRLPVLLVVILWASAIVGDPPRMPIRPATPLLLPDLFFTLLLSFLTFTFAVWGVSGKLHSIDDLLFFSTRVLIGPSLFLLLLSIWTFLRPGILAVLVHHMVNRVHFAELWNWERLTFEWLSFVDIFNILVRLLFVDDLASYFILDCDHFLRQYVLVPQIRILDVGSCSLAYNNLAIVLWRRVHLLDALMVRITSDWWNVWDGALIHKGSLVVNWLLLGTWSLHHLRIFCCGLWMVRLLEFALFLVSSVTSCFGEVPALDEFQVSCRLGVYARFSEVLGILMWWFHRYLTMFRLLDLVLLTHNLLLRVIRDLRRNHIRILIIWVGLISIAIRVDRLLGLDALLVRDLRLNISPWTVYLVVLVVTWAIRITMLPTSSVVEIWLHNLNFWRR